MPAPSALPSPYGKLLTSKNSCCRPPLPVSGSLSEQCDRPADPARHLLRGRRRARDSGATPAALREPARGRDNEKGRPARASLQHRTASQSLVTDRLIRSPPSGRIPDHRPTLASPLPRRPGITGAPLLHATSPQKKRRPAEYRLGEGAQHLSHRGCPHQHPKGSIHFVNSLSSRAAPNDTVLQGIAVRGFPYCTCPRLPISCQRRRNGSRSIPLD